MSARPTVLLVAHAVDDRGGMEHALAELVRRGSDRARFVVVSRALAPDLVERVEWERVRVPGRPAPLRFLLFFVVAGIRVARLRRSADLVHTLGAIVPNRADVATVTHLHRASLRVMGLAPGGLPPLRRLNTVAARLLALAAERWCYRDGRVGVLAAVSAGTAGEVEQLHPGIEVRVTPNGVDLERFRPDAGVRREVRLRHGTDEAAVVVLFVGGNWNLKGLPLAIEALARARGRTAARLELWVVGPGNRRLAEQWARRAGLDGEVKLLGRQPDPAPYDAAADLFVMPSSYETFSMAAYEAAAAELPVVAPPLSGIEEIIGEDTGGIRVERDPESLATAFVRLAGDEELRSRLGREARTRATAFDWQRSVDSVLGVYREALAEGRS